MSAVVEIDAPIPSSGSTGLGARPSWRIALLVLAACGANSACGSQIPLFSETLRADLVRDRGVQDRMQIAGAELRWVCRLEVWRSLSRHPHFGSAALVRGGLLITAAHNVASHPLNRIDRVIVICGEPDVRAPRYVADLGGERLRRRVLVADGYGDGAPLLCNDFERDYAFIDARDFFPWDEGFVLTTRDVSVDEPLSIAGYPGDRMTGCDRGADSCSALLHRATGRAPRQPRDMYVRYSIVTYTGNSGGPVYRQRDGIFEIVGVHVSGQHVGDDGLIGVARRIDGAVLRLRERALEPRE